MGRSLLGLWRTGSRRQLSGRRDDPDRYCQPAEPDQRPAVRAIRRVHVREHQAGPMGGATCQSRLREQGTTSRRVPLLGALSGHSEPSQWFPDGRGTARCLRAGVSARDREPCAGPRQSVAMAIGTRHPPVGNTRANWRDLLRVGLAASHWSEPHRCGSSDRRDVRRTASNLVGRGPLRRGGVRQYRNRGHHQRLDEVRFRAADASFRSSGSFRPDRRRHGCDLDRSGVIDARGRGSRASN